MRSFEFGICATQGERGYQEDSAVVWPGESTFPWEREALPEAADDRLVAVLADGMGGHAGGALASKAVCEAFVEIYAAADTQQSSHENLMAALDAGNSRIADIVQEDPALSGMGSTLVAAIFSPAGMEWISVGDSPLYLYRRAEIALLNEDHSLAPALDKLAEEGRITAAQAKADPRRHMLRSAITGEELDLIDVSRKPLVLEKDDYIIAASDGIHTLESERLTRVVTSHAADGPKAICEAIIREIDGCREPFQDNATVIAVRATV